MYFIELTSDKGFKKLTYIERASTWNCFKRLSNQASCLFMQWLAIDFTVHKTRRTAEVIDGHAIARKLLAV